MNLPKSTQSEIDGLSDADRFKAVMKKLVSVDSQKLAKRTGKGENGRAARASSKKTQPSVEP